MNNPPYRKNEMKRWLYGQAADLFAKWTAEEMVFGDVYESLSKRECEMMCDAVEEVIEDLAKKTWHWWERLFCRVPRPVKKIRPINSKNNVR